MSLGAFMEQYTPLVRDELQRCLKGVDHAPLKQAMGHLLGRGKLLRPLLVLAAYEASKGDAGPGRPLLGPYDRPGGEIATPPQADAAGGDTPAINNMVPYAAAFELIHTFTLIHDDLPCMDDADLRRGVQTVHLASGEATAVLAGDALLNLAFARLTLDHEAGVVESTRLRLVQCAARATHLVVEGQVLDLEGEGRELSAEQLKDLHTKKTGALLAACCQAGGILAGAEDGQLAKLWDAGVQLGLVFQMRDDLLSVTGDEAAVGKSLSADEALEKATYPRVLGVVEAEKLLERELARCREVIGGIGLASPELLVELAELAAHRDR